MNTLKINLIIIAVVFISSCMGFTPIKTKNYKETAKMNYDLGLKAYKKGSMEVAEKYFAYVRNHYPFSQYASLAELRIADTLLKRDRYSESLNAFQIFNQSHPGHPCTVYSNLRMAQSLQEQAPENWWFMPPAYERDQKYSQSSLALYRKVIKALKQENVKPAELSEKWKPPLCNNENYKKNRAVYLAGAIKGMKKNIVMLAGRELYVAEFNMSRDKPNGAIIRLEGVLKKYPEATENIDILRKLAEAYEDSKQLDKAVVIYKKISESANNDDKLEAIEKIKELKAENNKK